MTRGENGGDRGEREGDFTDNFNVTNKSPSPFLNLSSTRKYEFPHKNYQFDELLGLASAFVGMSICINIGS